MKRDIKSTVDQTLVNIENQTSENTVKHIIVTVGFLLVLTGVMLANLLLPDDSLSLSERRTLASVPNYSFEDLMSGALFEEFEKYSQDQFIFRDTFRGLKAVGMYYVLQQKDNNEIYIVDGNIYKLVYPLKETSVVRAAEKFKSIYRQYLDGKKVSYAIIPDKNYFVAEQNGYLFMDYHKMIGIMKQAMTEMTYIDLFSMVTIGDYYNTDLHWRQDKLLTIADTLLHEMGYEGDGTGREFSKKELYPFYGSYYGQAALPIEPDTLVYLTNSTIEQAKVYDYETKTYSKVYQPELFGEMDSYDVFLSGAKPLLTISNPECTTGKELILFRDSFGSSIAPLLLEGYTKITLVDLRYIATGLLGDYIDFSQDQDVLFLYNTEILNNSVMLK